MSMEYLFTKQCPTKKFAFYIGIGTQTMHALLSPNDVIRRNPFNKRKRDTETNVQLQTVIKVASNLQQERTYSGLARHLLQSSSGIENEELQNH